MDSFDNITRVEKNAPDTIYFPADGLPSYIDWDGSPIRTKQVEDSDICYIRKDALLEMLNKIKDDEGESGVTSFAYKFAIMDVIDKLKEL